MKKSKDMLTKESVKRYGYGKSVSTKDFGTGIADGHLAGRFVDFGGENNGN